MSEQACRFVLTERCHTHQDETGRYEDAVMCEQGLAALLAQLAEQERVIGRLENCLRHIETFALKVIQDHDWEGCGTCEEAKEAIKALSPAEPKEA